MSYTDQQSRIARAFCTSGTLCSVVCEHCGRTHFVSGPGCGDYEEGELERLQANAREKPDRYVEEATYDSIDVGYLQGKQFVPDCPCGIGEKVAAFLEDHAAQAANYLKAYFEDEVKRLRREADDAERSNREMQAAEVALASFDASA